MGAWEKAALAAALVLLVLMPMTLASAGHYVRPPLRFDEAHAGAGWMSYRVEPSGGLVEFELIAYMTEAPGVARIDLYDDNASLLASMEVDRGESGMRVRVATPVAEESWRVLGFGGGYSTWTASETGCVVFQNGGARPRENAAAWVGDVLRVNASCLPPSFRVLAFAAGNSVVERTFSIRSEGDVVVRDALSGDGAVYARAADFSAASATSQAGVLGAASAGSGGSLEVPVEHAWFGSFVTEFGYGPSTSLGYSHGGTSGACPCAFRNAPSGAWTFMLGPHLKDVRLVGVDARLPE